MTEIEQLIKVSKLASYIFYNHGIDTYRKCFPKDRIEIDLILEILGKDLKK